MPNECIQLIEICILKYKGTDDVKHFSPFDKELEIENFETTRYILNGGISYFFLFENGIWTVFMVDILLRISNTKRVKETEI